MTTDERAARLAAIAERAAARTPGRWRWRGHASAHSVSLQAIDRLCDYVLSFKRWGMQGAIPWFQRDPKDSAGIQRAKLIPRTHYDPWTIVGIDHPDARFIEHAPEDIDFLLGEVDRLRALAHDLADKENGARTEQMRALHAAGIIATDESLHAHIERADAFTARQHDRINFGEEDADGG